jgi:hypothetical protein
MMPEIRLTPPRQANGQMNGFLDTLDVIPQDFAVKPGTSLASFATTTQFIAPKRLFVY